MTNHTLHSSIKLDEAFRIDPAFAATVAGLLRAHGHPTFIAPVVGQTRRSDYPALFPSSVLSDCAVAVIALPDSMNEDDVRELTAQSLVPANIYSDDLQEKRCYLTVTGGLTTIHIDASATWVWEGDFNLEQLQLIWMYRETLFIIDHHIDEEWRTRLYLLKMTVGCNYRPHHEYTAYELSCALHRDSRAHYRYKYLRKVLEAEVYHLSRHK
jgi:hypothetical protein